MDDELPHVLGAALACVGLAAATGVVALVSYRRIRALERAWLEIARARGWEHVRAGGFGWVSASFGTPPRIRGTADGTRFEVFLSTWAQRSWDATMVTAETAVPADTPNGAEVLDDTLDPQAAEARRAVRARHPNAELRVWQVPSRTEPGVRGHAVALALPKRERDPEILAVAIALVVSVARRPPARFGAGYRQPWYFRY